MSSINKNLILECLHELSDRKLQESLWQSSTGKISSFTEVVEQLYTDSGLESKLQDHSTGFGMAAEAALLALSRQLEAIKGTGSPRKLIESDEMENVRQLAGKVLSLIENEPTSQP